MTKNVDFFLEFIEFYRSAIYMIIPHTYKQVHNPQRHWHMCAHACTHTHSHTHTHARVHTYACKHAHTHMHVRMHTHMDRRTCTHTHKCTCAHRHTQRHIQKYLTFRGTTWHGDGVLYLFVLFIKFYSNMA